MAAVGGLQEFAGKLLSDLRDRGARFALIGGFAVSIRTEPRFTRDIDLAIAVKNDAEAEALVKSLQDVGYRIFMVLAQESRQRLATVRLRKTGRDDEPLVADLLFASSGIEEELVLAATEETLPGIGSLPVATCGHLIALKVLSRKDKTRPNDAADLHALLRAAAPSDLAEAKRGLALIEKRGFHRERDLAALLEDAVREIAAG